MSLEKLLQSGAQPLQLRGGAGFIEGLLDVPADGVEVKGTAIVCHPHSLYGGTMHHKVVQTMAKAFAQCGWRAVRFNCRGVGKSAGEYDEGNGEADDLLEVIAQTAPEGQLCLAGFSFGTHVITNALERVHAERDIVRLVLVGTAASRFDMQPVPSELHIKTLVVHGEEDDTVPIEPVYEWVRGQGLPILAVPGVEHFFHGKLALLKQLVLRHIEAA